MKRRSAAPKAVRRVPLQARSRATLDRLLAATADLLAERRFEEATVADLVRRARSSVGAFYARFGSKEALLQEINERLFASGRASWKEFLAPERWEGASAGRILDGVVERLVERRRRHRGLLRALALYARSRPQSEFARRGARLNRLLTERLTELLLTRRAQIGHPRPARAIAFTLALVDAVTREAILFQDAGLSPAPRTDRELKAELARLVRLHLQIQED